MEWKPIETAPKDGTLIDLWIVSGAYGSEYRKVNCHWDKKFGWQHGANNVEAMIMKETGKPLVRATHWRPVPRGPK